MAPQDPRLVIGAPVHAKAIHISNFSECARMYGSAAGTKMIDGRVTAVTQEKSGKDRRVTTVTARWAMSRHEVQKSLGLRSVRAGRAPGPSRALPSPAAVKEPTSSAPDNSTSTALETLAEAASWDAPTPVPDPSSLFTVGGSPEDAASQPNDLPAPTTTTMARVAGPAPASQGSAALATAPVASPVGREITSDGAPSAPAAPAAGSAGPAAAAATSPSAIGSAGPAATPETTISVTAHGLEWHDAEVLQPIGGPVARRPWSVRTLGGDIITEDGDSVGYGRTRTPLDYFFSVFPQDQLARMARLTSSRLTEAGALATSPGELLKFIGILILITRFEFGSRAEL